MQMVIYQAASIVAHSARSNVEPPQEALETLASSPQEAQVALAHFGATRYARDLPQIGQAHQQSGQTMVLYKVPMPSEQQAKLSYEYLLSEFNAYLRRKISAVVMSESDAHVALWLPQGARLELVALWQDFITEMTTSEGLTRGFGLVMNSSKLSDRGFSTLEAPMVSAAQPTAVATFYMANLKHVEKRLAGRQGRIAALERKLEESLAEKERDSLQNKLSKEKDMQTKELTKYQSEFAKLFDRLLNDQLNTHNALNDLLEKYGEADTKTIERLNKQRSKLEQPLVFDREAALAFNELYQPDPFEFMRALAKHPRFGAKWRETAANAKRYSQIAANQLSTQKGDIYAKVIWEMCVLLFGRVEVTPLEPLVSHHPIFWGVHKAGDDTKAVCYSCGRLLESLPSFPSRRLAFESPDQRPQSGGSSGPAQICCTCAALSILSPIKFSPDTLVIRFGGQSIEQRVRFALEQQALNEIGATAGRYMNLSCTERAGDGTPASQKLGVRQYAVAKLAALYPPSVLRYLYPDLYQGGQTVSLSPALLVGVSTLIHVYRQRIQDGGDINMKLGEVVRYVEQDRFVEASYVLARTTSHMQTRELEEGTATYYNVLKEEGMNKQAEIIADVHGLIGLLMPFCRQIIARSDLNIDENDKWREVGKLIQSVEERPTVFAYTAGKRVGGVGNLTRDNNTHFVFDKAKELINKLGDIPVQVDEEGETVDKDPNRIRVTTDLVARAFEYIYQQERYRTDYDLKNFFYQVKLGLFARFPEAAKARGDK
jgi:hypothetical protein